jgi:hydrogenase/urease accessory protein HupE
VTRPCAGGLRVVGLALFAATSSVAVAYPSFAHPLDPALLALRETAPGTFDVHWKKPRMARAALDPALPERCRPDSPTSVRADARSVSWRWRVGCGAESLVGERFAVRGLDTQNSDALLRLELRDGRRVQAVLRADRPALTVPARATVRDVMTSYGALGVEHILGGIDHLLFVLGLVLLARGRRAILWTITAFTLGHSVTLALATLGVVHAPTQLIEALIAASIVLVGLELTRGRGLVDDAASALALLLRRPWLVAFAFGLLHGFGFAGALAQIGLPRGEIPLALLSFNLGIELGQIAFAAAILVLVAVLPLRWHAASRLAAAYGIGALGMLWLYERTLPLFIASI